MWRLVRASKTLDVNSPYAYLLLCSDFADTSLVAECNGQIVGFVGGYRPPARRASIFVWQILVAEPGRGRGIGARMLAALLDGAVRRGADTLEATVTPSNTASRALFLGFARDRGLSCREETAFAAELFPAEHEPEVRLVIGPVPGAERRE